MTTRSLLFRIILIMGGLYSIATFVVMSINHSYFDAQSQYLEAAQQVILLSRDTDEIFQIISLNGTTLDSQVDLLGMRPLPSNVANPSTTPIWCRLPMGLRPIGRAPRCIACLSLQSSLRAMYQVLLDQGEEVDQLRDMRDRVVLQPPLFFCY